MNWRTAVLTMPLLLAGFSANPASASMVVVQARGPGLTPGQVVAGGTTVTLPAGSRAVLLSQDGRTVTLSGPFSGAVPDSAGGQAGDEKAVTVLSRLMTASSSDSSALGVTRAADFGSPYAISVNGGPHCQVPGEKVRFEREVGSPEEYLTVTAVSGTKDTLTWPEDEAVLDWPAKVPFTEGAFTLNSDGLPKQATVKVQLIPAEIKGVVPLAVWMTEHGCQAQAKKLLTTLK